MSSTQAAGTSTTSSSSIMYQQYDNQSAAPMYELAHHEAPAAVAAPLPYMQQPLTYSYAQQQQQHQLAASDTISGGRSSIFFARVPEHVTEEQLIQLFSKYGTVEDLTCVYRSSAETQISKVRSGVMWCML
jgi:hypothetical protein